MPNPVFQIQSYAFNGHALPLFAAGALILFMSALTLTHERASKVAVPLFFLATASSIWLIGFSVMYCTLNADVALWWARISHIGIVFMPTTGLYFAAQVVGKDTFDPGRSLPFAAIVSVMFLALVYISPEFIVSMEDQWWGPYPLYGAIGKIFVVFMGLLTATCICLFWKSLRETPTDTSMHRRSKLFLVATCVGAVSIIDFMPMFGLNMFPIGRITMLFLFLITTYVTWRYRLVDLTPAYVGQQITDTMTDALVVMDRDGIVRLTNAAACRMLERAEEDMVGTPVAETLGESFRAHLQSLAIG